MNQKGKLFILTAAVLWGTTGLFYRNLSALGFTSGQAVFVRVAVSAVLLGAALLILDRKKLKIRLKDIPLFIGTGILSLAFFNLCYNKTMDYTALSVAAVLLYTAPVFVILLSAVIFKEKIKLKSCIALGITLAGCVLIAGISGETRLPMIALLTGLGSGLGYALYSIFGKLALRRYDPVTILFYTFLFASVAVIPFSNLTELPALLNTKSILLSLGMGVFCCFMPYLLYTKGLSYVQPGTAAILATIEPAVASIISLTVFREAMTPLQTVGIGLVFAAILILNINFKRGKAHGTEKDRPDQRTGEKSKI